MDPEQTAVWSWSTLFAIEASHTFQQTRKADDFACDWRIKLQGWGTDCPGQFILPPPPWYQSKYILLTLLFLNHLNVEMYQIINIIQVKFSCFLCLIVLYCMLSCRGGGGGVGWGAGCRGQFILPPSPRPPGCQSKIILLILLILNYWIWIQVKFSSFLCGILSYAKLLRWGREAVQGSFTCPSPKWVWFQKE